MLQNTVLSKIIALPPEKAVIAEKIMMKERSRSVPLIKAKIKFVGVERLRRKYVRQIRFRLVPIKNSPVVNTPLAV